MKFIIDILCWPWNYYQERKAFRKRIEELKKQDPYIYK